MLISKIPDNDGGKGESVAVPEEESDSHEYQTANQLFELMAKNQNFDTTDVDKLTTRDLVLLYKNIDLGTKLMTNATELRCKKPNQHVESVVYNDEAESDSDVSDMYSNEDLRSMFLINSERLDLLTAPPSAENNLCHKLGNLEMQTSNLATEYDKHRLFKDPYIKEQLKSLKLINKSSDFDGTVLPASLLDYICCKRLEDNYNFYMDNIIRYVKNTIDQLKRISNGDYLTDKAKEKWQEVENTAEDLHANTKVLATSTSIPLHVERKLSGQNTTWDDIVHSAVDIRSLSKILEKKIVLEIPKLLCGPYKLLSKCCAENLIISCKKEKRPVEERVDVVFKLQRSETGQVISNINSIMILHSAPVECDALGPEVLPLPLSYIEQTNDKPAPERKPKILELKPMMIDESVYEVSVDSGCSTHSSDNPAEDSFLDRINYVVTTESLKNSSCQVSTDTNESRTRDILDRNHKTAQKEAACDVFVDDLRLTIRNLTMQSTLKEESGEEMSQSTSKKKKSPTRVRIKSPYENKSYIMEEKKRRKLLEIRERRERKKMALLENCKITKHKYAKGNALPQSASSVTKLSISNKSFYNSIYGQTANVVPSKQENKKNRKEGKPDVLEINMDDNEGEHDVLEVSSSDMNSKKYINRSYYLDDAVTEMMFTNMKRNENDAKDLFSTSTSVVSNEFRNNLNYLSQLIAPSETDLNIGDDEIFSNKVKPLVATTEVDDIADECTSKKLLTCQSILNKIPSNSPNIDKQDNTDPKKLTSSVECRKSIDKIYNLMNKLGKAQETENKSTKGKFVVTIPKRVDEREGRTTSTFQGTESGTSLNHHITSSNPSSFSIDKNNTEKPNNTHKKKPGSLSPVTPKVIINSKSSLISKNELENNRKNRRPTRVSESPLKAISQLLHEFDNVQKTRQKPNTEQKHTKKLDMTSPDKNGSRKYSLKRRSRLDKHNESQTERNVRPLSSKEKKCKQHKEMDSPKIPYQQTPVHDKHTERLPRKKIIEILDEVKEARGEAVRGPSKFNSRLNSLAQPKRSYVQAHSEEFQTKYGKTLITDRLQRLAAAPALLLDRPAGSGNTRNKAKRTGSDPVPAVGVLKPLSPVPPSERTFRTRRSSNSSPEAKEWMNQVTGSSYKQASVPETPHALKKKMVAVDTYVKNHYGRARTTAPVSSEPQSAQKSRVPLLPNDIELASSISSTPIQESTELGSRLHYIISSIMKTTTSQGLEVLTECHENICLTENVSSAELLRTSSDSEYVLDILDDNNIITSVKNIDKASEKEQKQTKFENTAIQNDLQPVTSVGELEKLENALCNHVPVGTFQKRLRIKNLTMTPKQSMQQVFVLQSGDAGSLIVQTPIALNKKEKTDENFFDLTALPILSKSHLDWRFANIPMTISTVGYAYQDNKSSQRSSNSLVQLFDEVSINSGQEKPSLTNHKNDEGSYAYQTAQPTLRIEQAAQVDLATTLVTVGISSSYIHVKESNEKQEIKQGDTTNAEPKHFFKDFSQNEKVEGISSTYIHVKESYEKQEIKQGDTTNAEPKHFFKDCSQNEKGEGISSTYIHVKESDENQEIKQGDTTNAEPKHFFKDFSQNEKVEGISSTYIHVKESDENQEIKQGDTTNAEPKHVFKDFSQNENVEDPFNGEQTQTHTVIGKKENVSEADKPDNINYTTSLDILVGLLNEIQNITTCQTQMTKGDKSPLEDKQSKVLETLLINETAALGNSMKSSHCDAVSFTSLDRLRQLESNPSLYSFYLSDNEGCKMVNSQLNFSTEIIPNYTNEQWCSKRICVDKEVGVDFKDRGAISKLPGVTSQMLASDIISHSINMANSLNRVLSVPSIKSIFFAESPAVNIEAASLDQKIIIDIPPILITTEPKQSLDFYDVTNQIIEKPNENKAHKKTMETFEKERIKNMRKANNAKFRFKTDFDPIMKMKRDILVTVYSILVFTVFVALSFPEMLYRI